MKEIWKPVVGYEGFYSVSDAGRVRSETRTFVRSNGNPFTLTGRVLVQTPCRRGYPKVELWKGGVQRTGKVHILVCSAFRGPKPPGSEIRHLDGKPPNCYLSNLAYGTKRENCADMVRHGTAPRGERCGTAKLTAEQVKEIRQSSKTSDALASAYPVSSRHIRKIVRGERWAHL